MMASTLRLRQLRKTRGWSQVETAKRLGVSQPYLSLLESGAREVTPELSRRLYTAFGISPGLLPMPSSVDDWGEPEGDRLAERLAALGYEPLAYLRAERRPENPAAVLVWALGADNLEPRLTEALPWVLLRFEDLDVDWLVREAKIRDLQNRLGFVVCLAREVAGRNPLYLSSVDRLAALESLLERSRLVRADTLCEASMSERRRRFLEQSRSAAATHWNMTTGWKAEHLNYVS
jgi:transcriptional regulator with XRE-family HTH domain